jgi:hypothetical protein
VGRRGKIETGRLGMKRRYPIDTNE